MDVKNTFLSGIMNKDDDERLIKDDGFVHSENLRFFSNGQNGVGQYIKGTKLINDHSWQDSVCIHAKEDIENKKIYYWLASEDQSKIIEYNLETETSDVVLQSTAPNNILNFNPNKKILNSNIINGLLYWVEQHHNQPRFCNIERAKFYGPNNFREDDISVIKKPPFEEPKFTLFTSGFKEDGDFSDRWICFAYRYRYLDDEYSSVSFYSDWAFEPSAYHVAFDTMSNSGMQNNYNAATIFFNTGSETVKEIEVLFRTSNENQLYIIQSFSKEAEGWGNNQTKSVDFFNNKIYLPLPNEDVLSLYDNIPRLAKIQDIVGSRLFYGNYFEGYDESDCSGNKINYNISLDLIQTKPSQKIQFSFSGILAESESIVIDFENSEGNGIIELKLGDQIFFISTMNGEDDSFQQLEVAKNSYVITLSKDYTNLNELILSEEFTNFINSLKSDLSNFIDDQYATNSSITPNPDNFKATVNGTKITINYARYTLSFPPDINGNPIPDVIATYKYNTQQGNNIFLNQDNKGKTLKSNRSYEVGVVYYDDYNRIVSFGVSKNNTIFIDHTSGSIAKNSLLVSLNHRPPCQATKYKIAIKQNKKEYENVFSNQFYNDGLYRWVRLIADNKSKVKEGDVLIIKQDSSGEVSGYIEKEVLEAENKPYNFLTNQSEDPGDTIKEDAGFYIKIDGEGVDIKYEDEAIVKYRDRDTDNKDTPIARVDFCNKDNQPLGIPAGSTVKFKLYFKKNRFLSIRLSTLDLINGDFGVGIRNDDIVYFESYRIVAQKNYNNIKEIFDTQGIGYGQYPANLITWGTNSNGCPFISVRGANDGDLFEKASIEIDFEIRLNISNMVAETKPKPNEDLLYYEAPGTYKIQDEKHLDEFGNSNPDGSITILSNAYNAYSFGNGVESHVYKDKLSAANNFMNFNFRGWTTLEGGYKFTHRAEDVTYSDNYRTETKFNGLSKFYQHTANWFTLPQENGSIQNIRGRDTDLFVAQENKLGKITYGKSILYDQQGIETVQTSDNVLGSYLGFIGIHGISQNPESLAEFNKVLYLTDKVRGQILSVMNDSVIVLSENKLENYSREAFINPNLILGGFDPNNYEYLIHLDDIEKVLSFQQLTKGFTTFYTYQPDFIRGVNKALYLWKNGQMYKANCTEKYNEFFGVTYPSKISFSVNKAPSDIKVFNAITLESTDAWSVQIKTNLTKSNIDKSQFKKKEGFWHTHFNRNTNPDLSNTYGIGEIINISGGELEFGVDLNTRLSIGDSIGINNSILGEVLQVNDRKITIQNASSLVIGNFVYGIKNALIDGEPLRGYYARVDLETTPTTKGEIFSVNTNIKKSYL